jgi:xylose isomerase
MPTWPYAARLNAFKLGAATYWPGRNRITALDLIARAATVEGLGAVDVNYPDHLEGITPADLKAGLSASGVALNGFAMRYAGDPVFRGGALMNADRNVRQAAIDLARRGIDALREADGSIMTLWLGQDGFDYPFQLDYARAWDDTVEAIAAIADHDRSIDISLEYKPNEPRAFALMPDIGTTLLLAKDIARPNLGVTLDFAHVLYAGEMPAYAAMLAARHSRLLGVHLNDGYGHRDDGLMVGSVHLQQTVELLWALDRMGYDGTIYFDTFPDQSGVDPNAECAANIAAMRHILAVVGRLKNHAGLAAAIARQDAPASQRLVQSAIFGAAP